MALTVGSLFSGIGGIDLGLERAGMEVKWQSEIDAYCSKVLAKKWPEVTNYGDITQIDWSEVENVDVICGGFPCQPFSVAGKKLGTADKRWLWPEFHNAICELRPRFVLVENVPGLLMGGGINTVLGDLAEVGYDAEWETIPAAAFGAPHLRYRIFLLAYSQRNELRIKSGRSDGEDRTGTYEPEYDGQQGSMADSDSSGFSVFQGRYAVEELRRIRASYNNGWWAVEPDVGRVAHGVPKRVDRLKSLGNAVVPQMAEWVGRCVVKAFG